MANPPVCSPPRAGVDFGRFAVRFRRSANKSRAHKTTNNEKRQAGSETRDEQIGDPYASTIAMAFG